MMFKTFKLCVAKLFTLIFFSSIGFSHSAEMVTVKDTFLGEAIVSFRVENSDARVAIYKLENDWAELWVSVKGGELACPDIEPLIKTSDGEIHRRPIWNSQGSRRETWYHRSSRDPKKGTWCWRMFGKDLFTSPFTVRIPRKGADPIDVFVNTAKMDWNRMGDFKLK